jgi:hypothetical protein
VERSQRKLRPSLPRLKDLRAVPLPAKDRSVGRGADGRFAPGNRHSSRSRGWRKALVQLAGPHIASSDVQRLASDSATLFRACLAELPCDGPTVSRVLAESARSSVVSTHLAARALELGIETAKGRALLELSMKLGQRAERTAVTAYDLAQRLAEAQRKAEPMGHLAWLNAGIDDAPGAPPANAHAPAEGDDAPEQADAAAGRAGANTHAPKQSESEP